MNKLFLTLLITLTFFACKKETTKSSEPPHEIIPYEVWLIGNDTTKSSVMWARTETVGLIIVEDSRLKAVVTAYDGHGKFTVEVTNKQSCQVIIRWGYDGELSIQDPTPTDSTADTPQSDVLKANQVKVFTINSNAKEGRIKLQAQGVDCGNSSTLIINVTLNLLPVKLINNTASYDRTKNKTTISFTVDDPTIFDWILIRRMNDQKVWEQAALIGCDHITKTFSIKL